MWNACCSFGMNAHLYSTFEKKTCATNKCMVCCKGNELDLRNLRQCTNTEYQNCSDEIKYDLNTSTQLRRIRELWLV